MVQCARCDFRAGFFEYRNGFAREHGLIQIRVTSTDHTIDRHLLSGFDAQ
ncbi:Uncharacterised protein [Vibrio cholerae]|nr:Uncharacterised protein [Vibrio cholerae]CSI95212.1 Uncharacterised protein [Vibrio cholerae]